MSKVKLLSNLTTENGVVAEGTVVDLPDAQAEKLISLGAAEATDEAVSPAPQPAAPKAPEVETPTDPLVSTQVVGEPTPSVQPEVSPAPQSQETQPSSSTNLHLG